MTDHDRVDLTREEENTFNHMRREDPERSSFCRGSARVVDAFFAQTTHPLVHFGECPVCEEVLRMEWRNGALRLVDHMRST